MSRPLISAVPAEGGNKPVRIELKRKYFRIRKLGFQEYVVDQKNISINIVPTALDLSLCDFSRTKLR